MVLDRLQLPLSGGDDDASAGTLTRCTNGTTGENLIHGISNLMSCDLGKHC